jgi:hypothetical protein
MQARMLLPLTVTIMALMSRVVSDNISVPLCRLKNELLPEKVFRQTSCFRCYQYMHNSSFKPGMKDDDYNLFTDQAAVSYTSI